MSAECRASLRSVEIVLFPNSEEKLVPDVIQDCCAQLMSRFPPPNFWITLQLDSKKTHIIISEPIQAHTTLAHFLIIKTFRITIYLFPANYLENKFWEACINGSDMTDSLFESGNTLCMKGYCINHNLLVMSGGDVLVTMQRNDLYSTEIESSFLNIKCCLLYSTDKKP